MQQFSSKEVTITIGQFADKFDYLKRGETKTDEVHTIEGFLKRKW